MTLDFSPELETQIEHAARLQGTNAPSFVTDAARAAAQAVIADEAQTHPLTKEERRALLNSLRGRFAGCGPTVDEFLAERSEEGHREADK